MHSKVFALAGLANIAGAHMIMSSPFPFSKDKITNGPLDASGADFPCKFNGGYGPSPGDSSNVYAQGSTQKLEFIGTATHGGGSCQVSLTTDLKPTKNSVWKVIKSIHGGCVAKNTPGNMGDDAHAKDPFTYDFSIPKELASGNYTLAWTWFNKVGNREMYMNCAPVTVTGSGGSQTYLNGLPDMFVANTGNGCQTVEKTDVIFPDPGKDVDNFGGSTMLSQPTPVIQGSCKSGSGSGGNGGASKPAATAPPAAPPASAPAAGQPAPAQKPQPSAPAGDAPSAGGVFVQVSPPTGPAPTQPATAPAGSSKPAFPANGTSPAAPVGGSNPPPAAGAGNGGASSSSGSFAAGTACSGDVWNCVGGTSFQRCVSNAWAATQPVAPGTACIPGQSSGLQVVHANGSRAVRFVA